MARKKKAERGVGKPFDATTKILLDAHPDDWLRYLELPIAPVSVLDTDLSTLSVAADRVWRVDAPTPFLVHFELQASHDGSLVERSHRYNVILRTEYDLPVLTVLILLRRDANLPAATGRYEQTGPTADCFVTFGYRVLRLWEIEPERLLEGGLGLVPLAPLGNVAPEATAQIVQAAAAKIVANSEPEAREETLTSLEILLGLRFEADFIHQLMKGVRQLEESTIYQEIFAKGEARGEVTGEARGETRGLLNGKRSLLVRLGTKRFGSPTRAITDALGRVRDEELLDQMAERLLEVKSWDELLA